MTRSGKAAGPREKLSRPLADLVNRAMDPLIQRQGFGESALLLQWEAIMGERIAAVCEPVKLQWPRSEPRRTGKPDRPATLVLRVEPGFGLDVQHMSSAIIERVNTHLGWRCVARLSIRQECLAPKSRGSRRAAPEDPSARAEAERATEGVLDEGLRSALIALGERALARKISRQ